jgi:16S rRNA (cytidine1402-2'-O)-methyltransferase
VQQALASGHQVSPVPGPNAPLSALIASGLPADKFIFLGYLPRKSSDRRQVLSQVSSLPFTLIFFETPHRLQAALKDLLEELGDRQIAIGREITKMHEEFFRGSISQALSHFTTTSPRGEFTLVVAGYTLKDETWSEDKVLSAIQDGRIQGLPPAQLAGQIAAASNWPRRRIYQLIIEMD